MNNDSDQLELRLLTPGTNYYFREQSRMRYPERHRARNRVYRAIKSGKLERLPCEVCGDEKSEAHHHNGYEVALDVQWLCRQHHIKAEKSIKWF